jgi:guanylate kinase
VSTKTTEELPELQDVVGQAYNLYALGPTGAGKHSVLRRLIEQHAVD